MKKILIAGLCILGFVLWVTVPIFPAAIPTEETSAQRDRFQKATVKKITFAWTANASGVATGATTYYYSGETKRIVFIPGTGTGKPSALYDVTITDDDSVDILDGDGADLSSAATVQLRPDTKDMAAIAEARLTCTVSNAGSGKTGTVIIYLR